MRPDPSAPSSPPIAEARCALHPTEPAVATCARCGAFLCFIDQRHFGGKVYCALCGNRPDVDYLEAFRLKYWGKRDAWAWVLGFAAVVNFAGGVGMLIQGVALEAAVLIGLAVVDAFYFAGKGWARYAVFALPVWVVLSAVASGVPQGAVAAAIPFLLLLAIFNDTRNQLFFQVEVSREKLQKAWDLYANNSLARTGFLASFLALALPGLALLTLPLCIVGLTRVDPTANPPIGRKGQAIAGIVLSCVGLIGWGALLALRILGLP